MKGIPYLLTEPFCRGFQKVQAVVPVVARVSLMESRRATQIVAAAVQVPPITIFSMHTWLRSIIISRVPKAAITEVDPIVGQSGVICILRRMAVYGAVQAHQAVRLL